MKRIIAAFVLTCPLPLAAQTESERLKALEDRLSKLEAAPAKTSISAFNPSIGVAIDAVVRDSNDHANFDLRAAELNLEAPIDPFLKGWAVVTASSDGVALEEAAMQTVALPHSLQATAGRFFAPMGRFSQWHDHELPMVDRPNSINTYVGGEARVDGLQADYLLPTPFYLGATLAAANKLGADNNRTDNARFQAFDRWTQLARLHAYFDLTADVGADLGASLAWTPKSDYCSAGAGTCPVNDSWRTLTGADFTLRYQPAAGGMYKGFVWGTEVLQNSERGADPFTNAPIARAHSWSGYSNVETKLGRVVRAGGFVDLTELPTASRYMTKTFAGYLTFEITEFNRLRVQYSRIENSFPGTLTMLPGTDFGNHELVGLHRGNLVMLQWSTVLGYHVHGFRGRWGT